MDTSTRLDEVSGVIITVPDPDWLAASDPEEDACHEPTMLSSAGMCWTWFGPVGRCG
jgi:hypothetical protein